MAFERNVDGVPAAARAEMLSRVTAAIADAVTSEQVFEALVDHVADAVGASSAALWLVRNAETATLVRGRGYSDAAMRALETVRLAAQTLPVVDCMVRGEPIWIGSQADLLVSYPHLAAMVSVGRSYRVFCLPLITQGHVQGALALTAEQPGHIDHADREFLLIVARYASQAIERVRLFEAERQSRAAADAAASRLATLARASRVFAESDLDVAAQLQRVASELSTALDSCIAIGLIEPDGSLRMAVIHHPIAEAQAAVRAVFENSLLRVGEGITGAVAATGESVLIPHIDAELVARRAAPGAREFLERFPAHALIGSALKARGRIIGTVTAARVRAGETYAPEDLRLLEELAERAAASIENSRLFQETVGARTRAEQLYAFAQAVASADTLDAVYEAALRSIQTALGVRRAAVLVFDDDDVLRFKASANLSQPYQRAVEGHCPWPRDARAPEPVLVADAQRDPAMSAYVPLFREEGIGALAFIPLVTPGTLLGKFMVYHDEPHAFTAQEVETARAIANHLASVIVRFAAMARLAETVRMNELFAGVLAHDLRNPLNAIVMAAHLMLAQREGQSSEAMREMKPLGHILASGQRMANMIEQLLDFTRARSGGGIAIEPHDTNLADLAAQAIGELELARPEWVIEREVTGDQRGSWDSGRLLQVLSNLVANAGQHGTPGAPILVKLDGTRREAVALEVRNRGAIPASLLPQLFSPFRSTRHRRDLSRGLGLGLFIIREIVRAHGGSVSVASTEEAGTCIRVELPRLSAR